MSELLVASPRRLHHVLFWSAPVEDSELTAEDPLALDYLTQQVGLFRLPTRTTRSSRAQAFAMVLYGLDLVPFLDETHLTLAGGDFCSDVELCDASGAQLECTRRALGGILADWADSRAWPKDWCGPSWTHLGFYMERLEGTAMYGYRDLIDHAVTPALMPYGPALCDESLAARPRGWRPTRAPPTANPVQAARRDVLDMAVVPSHQAAPNGSHEQLVPVCNERVALFPSIETSRVGQRVIELREPLRGVEGEVVEPNSFVRADRPSTDRTRNIWVIERHVSSLA